MRRLPQLTERPSQNHAPRRGPPGVGPIHHPGGLRVGSVDIHTASRRVGFFAGRVYVPQGLGLDNVTWFSAKDLVHMQIIDAAADNGLLLYYQAGP
jgi:hypothetical protein